MLNDHRAAALLAFLDAKAEGLGAEGHLEQTFEQSVTRVTLRFTLGREFGELVVAGRDGLTSEARVYAAGPIERILGAIGFREVARELAVARRYRFHGAVIQVAHAEPEGWFCEIRRAPGRDGAGERRLAERRSMQRRAPGDGRPRDERRNHDRRLRDRRVGAGSIVS